MLLPSAGLRVAVVERGPLAGRAQEWNISKKEMEELVRTGSCSGRAMLMNHCSCGQLCWALLDVDSCP